MYFCENSVFFIYGFGILFPETFRFYELPFDNLLCFLSN